MIQKRNPPYWVLPVLLAGLLLVSYFVSGLYLMEGVTLRNLSNALYYIFTHPFQNWANDKTPACLGVGVLVWVFLAMYIVTRCRNFHGGAEYGTEDWGDVREICKRLRNPDDTKNRILSRNLAISLEGPNKLSNNNMLVIGSSGTYKTNAVVTPNLLRAAANYIVLDVKGELMYKYGRYLQKKEYVIRSLNLKNQEKSDRYNPYEYIETEEDVIRIIDNIREALTPPDSMRGDPFWKDGSGLYLQALFFYEWYIARQEGRKGDLNHVMALLNDELTPAPTGGETPGQKGKTKPPSVLQTKMKLLEEQHPGNPASRDYRKLKEGAEETVRSIVIIVNAMLKLFETEGLRRIFSGDDLKLREFATGVDGTVEKPTDKRIALFICVPDNDQSFHFIASMLYTQALDLLSRMADTDFRDRGGALPIPMECWMDEFYAGARPKDTDSLMGIVRSRNISLIPILQSVAQIRSLFQSDKWEIIMDNCAVLMFLGAGSGALETHKYLSDLLGDQTIDTANDSKSGRNENINYGRTGRKLMTPAEIRRMNRENCIIIMEGQPPVYDRKALPWEMPEKTVPYKTALNCGEYVHPVRVVRDREGQIHTIRDEKREALEFLENRPEADMAEVTEEEFLHWNLRSQTESKEKRIKKYALALNKEKYRKEFAADPGKWLREYAGELDQAQMDELLGALEDGLSGRQAAELLFRPAEEMQMIRRLYHVHQKKNNS